MTSPSGDGDDDYQVGYRRPPKHSQFQPGRSGNPKGRPKGTKNLKSDLVEELSELILVREGDQARRVSKQRAVVKTLVARTLKGDTRAAALLISMMSRLIDTSGFQPQPEAASEEETLASLVRRMSQLAAARNRNAEADPEPSLDANGDAE